MMSWLAVFLGYSRIYLGVHFPADVAVGTLVGALWGGAMYLLSRPIANRIKAFEDR